MRTDSAFDLLMLLLKVGTDSAGVLPTEDRDLEAKNGKAIRVLGVIVNEVSEPQIDGNGRTVYDVPLQLSARVPGEWARYFLSAWHSGPQISAKHRPEVANVGADRIVLEGTTIDEVEQFLEAIKFAVSEANRKLEEEAMELQEGEIILQQKRKEHLRHVAEVAKRLKFQD